ncbi:hypothetical protein MASR1M74_31710 [Lentimicrobium sp.]
MMGSKKCNSNVALAQIMTEKYDEANASLKCAPESAHNYYLMAVAHSRKGNVDMMMENLQKAFEQDATLKAKAAEDREFIKYFSNPEFINLVK